MHNTPTDFGRAEEIDAAYHFACEMEERDTFEDRVEESFLGGSFISQGRAPMVDELGTGSAPVEINDTMELAAMGFPIEGNDYIRHAKGVLRQCIAANEPVPTYVFDAIPELKNALRNM